MPASGGGCLPKDIRAFSVRAEELRHGESVAILREVDAINLRRRDRAVGLVLNAFGGSVFKKNVTLLGATFKLYSDDIRRHPQLQLCRPRRRSPPRSRRNRALGIFGTARLSSAPATVVCVGTAHSFSQQGAAKPTDSASEFGDQFRRTRPDLIGPHTRHTPHGTAEP
ncbi:hypothetical protein [Microbacterium sp.]|uniref:hypothetical protein n=1 Tax=Microbacterium sp. TaxID=51671 RepID=UPI0039C908CE